MVSELRVTLVQGKPTWHDPSANVEHYAGIFSGVKNSDVVVLPEMWNTGYTIHAHRYADHSSVAIEAMMNWAKDSDAHIIGSIITQEEDQYFNRLYVVNTSGVLAHYDKKHLFAFAGEDRVFSGGNEKVIYDIKGWRLCLNVCYDLRFPVWCRNMDDYDALLFSANWPDKRIEAWDTLLRARAIENQSYVLGTNCVGKDLWDNNYSGHSAVIDPLGEILAFDSSAGVTTLTQVLSKDKLETVRETLPFLKDKDEFNLI